MLRGEKYRTEVLTVITVELEGSFHLVSSAGLLRSCTSEKLWVEPLKILVSQPILFQMAMKEQRYLQPPGHVMTQENDIKKKNWELESMLKDGNSIKS